MTWQVNLSHSAAFAPTRAIRGPSSGLFQELCGHAELCRAYGGSVGVERLHRELEPASDAAEHMRLRDAAAREPHDAERVRREGRHLPNDVESAALRFDEEARDSLPPRLRVNC